MVHQRGFEPLTARFVAEYSIQLSYWCKSILNTTLFKNYLSSVLEMVHQRGFEPLTARFVAEYSIQLSYWCTKKPNLCTAKLHRTKTLEMAESEGFEPSMSFTPYSLSRGAPSATRPTLRNKWAALYTTHLSCKDFFRN